MIDSELHPIPICPHCKQNNAIRFIAHLSTEKEHRYVCDNCFMAFLTWPIPYESVDEILPIHQTCGKSNVELTARCRCLKNHQIFWCHECMSQFDVFQNNPTF